ncbi:MAG: cytochrome c-type biosis protein CcmF [Chloroflexota bacterium]|nr:cytochrome c-type biosis protein CcmF [Chloroflexota bacterium]
MVALMGKFLLGLAALAALYAALASALGHSKNSAAWKQSADHAMLAHTLLLGASVLFLGLALLFNQFELRYVYEHSSLALPTYLKISAIWAGQEGSLLFWSLLQSLFTLLAVGANRRKNSHSVYLAAVVLNLLTAFFTSVTFLVQDPFVPLSPAPLDGLGLNPLLRHPGMAFHPPALYLGYVGLSVPFAFSLAALISGKTREWAQPIHRWALFSWFGLGIGLLLGMRWAYDVLGWGGYWGWDAVENAALMPWLVSSALIHVDYLREKEERSFNNTYLLAVLAYLLVVFGTYVTRSGQIQSVHAYTQSVIGPVLLGAQLVLLAVSATLFFAFRQRSSAADAPITFRSAISRLTTLILLTLTFSIFLGTILPNLTQAFSGQASGVSTAWFDRVSGPQFAVLVLLMGLCPLAARALAKVKRWQLVLAGLAGGLLFGALCSLLLGEFLPEAFLVFSLIGFSISAELFKYIGLSRRRKGSKAHFNTARLSSWMVHSGLILLALGVFASKAYEFSDFQSLQVGQSASSGGYDLEYQGIEQELRADYLETKANLQLSQDGRILAHMTPFLNQFADGQQSMTMPAVRSSLANDVYVVLSGWSDNGNQATFQIFVNPLINFMWFGGVLLLAGGYLSLKPRSARPLGRALYWAGALLFVVLAVWLMWGSAHGVSAQDNASLAIGSPAPQFDTLTDFNGQALAVDFSASPVTIVNFWAPWCPACREELPALQTLWETYQDHGLALVGITYETDRPSVQESIETYNLAYPIVLDPDASLSMQYGVTGVPETYIVDQSGNITYIAIGAAAYENMEAAVLEALGQTSAHLTEGGN